jgi:hypothetical protein
LPFDSEAAGQTETDGGSNERFGARRDSDVGDQASAGALHSAAVKASQLGKAVLNSATSPGKLASVVDRFRRNPDDESSPAEPNEVDSLEGEMREKLAFPNLPGGGDTSESANAVDHVGDEVRAAARVRRRNLSSDADASIDELPDAVEELSRTRTGSHPPDDLRKDGRGPDIGPLPESSGRTSSSSPAALGTHNRLRPSARYVWLQGQGQGRRQGQRSRRGLA